MAKRNGWGRQQRQKLSAFIRELAKDAAPPRDYFSTAARPVNEPYEAALGVFYLGQNRSGGDVWGIAPQRFVELVERLPGEKPRQAQRGAALCAAAVRQHFERLVQSEFQDTLPFADAPPTVARRGPFRVVTRRASSEEEL